MIVIGVDPGIAGALAILDLSDFVVIDMPILQIKRGSKTKSIVDTRAMGSSIRGTGAHVFIEIAGSRPRQSTSSTSTVWMNYGRILGCLEAMGFPITEVSSKKWKNTMRVPADKDGARFRASQLLPQYAHNWDRKKDHGRAEAALIALYGQRELNKN